MCNLLRSIWPIKGEESRVTVKPQLRLGLLLLSLSAAGTFGKDLPNYDETAVTKSPARAPRAALAGEKSLVSPGSEIRMDERMGLPTFIWAAPARPSVAAALAGGSLTAEQVARIHLAEFAPLYALDAADAQAVVLDQLHDTGTGAIIATFRQEIGGIEVFRDRMRLAMGRDLKLIAISGYLPPADDVVALGPAAFLVSQAEAIAAALKDLSGEAFSPVDFKDNGARQGAYEYFDMTSQADPGRTALVSPARIRKVLFHLPGRLEPAWHLEINAQAGESADADYYAYVISAVDGHLMFRMNLTVADSFSYRVWAQTSGQRIPSDGPQGDAPTPHPTGLPDGYQAPFISPSLITLQNGPISTNDPWLPSGATQTSGNNVDAYADLSAPDGFSAGDFRADTTSPGVFDRTYNTALGPQTSQNQQKAAITQLFYDNNFLHDWFYDAGFNEVSGNAQLSNFGRGGLQSDPVRAEGQDSGSRNNANMATPSDGASPRMQMYVFDGNGLEYVEFTPPGGLTQVGHAEFGIRVFDVTADVVLVTDNVAPFNDGCTAFSNDVLGKIALIDRGNCNFTVKVTNAENAGAEGVIIANNVSPGVINMGGTAPITIGSLMISQADGNALKTSLLSGPVSGHMVRLSAIDRDGTIDNHVVAHEWGHYISNRLIGNAGGLNTNMAGGLGEGWGDFTALLMSVRPEDTLNPTNTTFNGVYGLAGYVMSGGINNGYYFGIRRVPYSTNLARDPLTFRHIADGQTITGAPIAFGADGTTNSEVHNTGEVWATMLWECYASLLRDTLGASPRLTFLQAQDRMRRYLVAGYKLTPNSPTLLEARDAILAAAYAADLTDFERFWGAFARRGAGLKAVGPDRFSINNSPVTESYLVGGQLVVESTTLNDSVITCDADGILDNGDTGLLTITLRNNGSATLTGTTATISSASPGVSFPQGASFSFPNSIPYNTTTASVQVALAGGAPQSSISFNISINDPALAVPGPFSVSAGFLTNVDEIPGQLATDTVEARALAWTPGNNPALDTSEPWRRLELSPTDHRLLGPDSGAESDQYLVSPVLAVGAGTFSFTFRHRHSFEVQTSPPPPIYFDGGVIELSNNGGATWVDIGASASPTYGGVIASGGFNPLQTRQAYVATSPGYLAGLNTVTVNLGTTYAGQSVQIRFRIGTDVSVGAPGWEIDDIAFNNIVNRPFTSVVSDRHQCVVTDSDGDGFADPSDCAPLNGAVWAAPTEARDLTLTNPGTALGWLAPSSPGGTTPLYDVLRSTSGSSFMGAACLETADSDLSATDTAVPGVVYYYLVRAGNVCGSTLGASSAGTPRVGATCP